MDTGCMHLQDIRISLSIFTTGNHVVYHMASEVSDPAVSALYHMSA